MNMTKRRSRLDNLFACDCYYSGSKMHDETIEILVDCQECRPVGSHRRYLAPLYLDHVDIGGVVTGD